MCQTRYRILDEIQRKREKMISSAEKNGFTSDDTLRYSMELDKLIFEYQSNYKEEIQETEVNFSIKQMILIWPKACI
ncbi:aspartyl-phosphate phosphatase Spo0E family protein [Bacillus massilinigeriensis]|uniref:aspartyl-phosphate phosphatase Spo0E family protein n=1 Tax=Bacillus massilionigeriensis TaxID=1805475 RepID=UPI001F2BAFAF|nr:aspartyl-phosphate phosphatase Spo0E family protein [Bacillus massilionigeriensis]